MEYPRAAVGSRYDYQSARHSTKRYHGHRVSRASIHAATKNQEMNNTVSRSVALRRPISLITDA